jgi:hypothetical protein
VDCQALQTAVEYQQPERQRHVQRIIVQDFDRVGFNLSIDLDWTLRKVIKADPEKNVPYEAIYMAKDKVTSVHVIQDPLVHMEYLVVRGEHAEEETERIRKHAKVIEREDALRMVDEARTPEDKKRALAIRTFARPRLGCQYIRAGRSFGPSSRPCRTRIRSPS